MARYKTFNIEETLDKAMLLFWQKGYEATSIRDLTQAMGISRSSLYDTFGDKHQIYVSALNRYRAIEYAQLTEILNKGNSIKVAFEQLLSIMLDNLLGDEQNRGSFVANAMVEHGSHDPIIAALVTEYSAEIYRLFGELFAQAQSAGEMSTHHSPQALAHFFLHSLYGLYVAARFNPDRTLLEDVTAVMLAIFDK